MVCSRTIDRELTLSLNYTSALCCNGNVGSSHFIVFHSWILLKLVLKCKFCMFFKVHLKTVFSGIVVGK